MSEIEPIDVKNNINSLYSNATISEVHWSVNLSIYGCIGFTECLIAVLIFSQLCLPESRLEQFYLILIGILSLFAQMTFVIACKFENAATVCLLRNAFNVIFAFIFQIAVFQVKSIHYF